MSKDINIGAIGEALNTKMDRDTNNATAPFRGFLQALKDSGFYMVIETWTNPDKPTDGYRIWSDGYCEQWGQITSGSGWRTINFSKTFKNKPIITTSCCDNGSKDQCPTTLSTNSITTSSFQCSLGWASSNQWGYITASEVKIACWRASGYLAEGEY